MFGNWRKGYVMKNISKDDLLKAIDTVFQDKPYLDVESQEKLIASMLTRKKKMTEIMMNWFARSRSAS